MMGYERLGYGVGHMAGGFGIGGHLFGLFVFALVATLLIWLIVGRKHGMAHAGSYHQMQPVHQTGSQADAALVIARERLSKGEIDVDQYTAIMTALRS